VEGDVKGMTVVLDKGLKTETIIPEVEVVAQNQKKGYEGSVSITDVHGKQWTIELCCYHIEVGEDR